MRMMIVLLVFASVSMAAPITAYANRAAFEGQLATTVVDDYENPGYDFINTNAAMSAVLGETDYRSTGWNDLNIISGSGEYCAGCNGSFEMGFTTTSVGTADGVYGVGFDIAHHQLADPYYAFVTLADGTTQNYLLGAAGTFWGITSSALIESIHIGYADGGTRTNGSLSIDNLTIGSPDPVPEPSTLFLFGVAAAGAYVYRRRRSAA